MLGFWRMELTGLEPATSWVRSRRTLALGRVWCPAIPPPPRRHFEMLMRPADVAAAIRELADASRTDH